MKRTILLIPIILLNYCCTRSNEENASPISNNWIEIIQDPLFENGFALTPLDPKIVQEGGGFEKTCLDTLDFYGNGSHPIWRLAQWTSKYNFANSLPKQELDGSISYTNSGESKKIALYLDHSLLLEVNASKEYDAPRIDGQPWPHLLIEQDFKISNTNIGQSERLEFSMELKLEKEENKMTPETFNPLLHTAQTPFYFFIINKNQNSSDYNQHIWFGIPSYDYRYSELSNIENVLWDIGTNTFIYTVPPRSIWGNISFQDKKWHKCECDLKPWIARALEAMKEKDVFLNTTLNDLAITGMNFGWEVPGTFDVAIRVKNISLKKMIQ